jgi:chromosome segregation ATPase
MQVARNFFLSREKTLTRKLYEALLALRIENSLTKDQILEIYINQIYLGQRAYGFGTAANIYFGKNLAQLNTAEIAMLAGLPKAPSLFNPVINPKRARQRQLYVLRRMHELAAINDAEYEQAEMLLNQLQLSVQTAMLRLQQHLSQLKQFGYEQPLETTEKQVQEAETTIKMMRFELERIGGVNQLAMSHYAEQTSRYRELSLRLNELEREKQAIVQFMDEIEAKKRKVFMDAFEKINTNLTRYFSKLTGGGGATLQLENPEDCFQGGIDMMVQFPNKPSIVVSGASGGERSVAAVSFIFALKEFTPAAFYILDEIDAHLDAYHVSKLADVLLEESEKIQFIVITLKPEMVNRAQRVYGVYERNGVSNVITTKFLEATH